jgi:hypothetical protein
MTIEERVISLAPADLEWPFEGSGTPRFYTRKRQNFTRDIPVDPFPAYAHSPELVCETAAAVEASFPLESKPDYYLLPFESTHRTNGWSLEDQVYESDSRKPKQYESNIILSGKRIPIHPGMTRYLVAHEYGHLVDWAIARRLKMSDGAFRQMYRETFRPDASVSYGGGRWHANIGELIANDFRICVARVEPEFWPHPGFDHPHLRPAVRDFWLRMVSGEAA